MCTHLCVPAQVSIDQILQSTQDMPDWMRETSPEAWTESQKAIWQKWEADRAA